MNRPRINLRSAGERAAYGELTHRLNELKRQQRARLEGELELTLRDYGARIGRKVLIDAFAELDPEARHAVALKLVSDDED